MVHSPEQSSHLGSTRGRRGFSSTSAESSVTTSTVRRDNEAREIHELLQNMDKTDSEQCYVRKRCVALSLFLFQQQALFSWWVKWTRYVGFLEHDDVDDHIDTEDMTSETPQHPGPVERWSEDEDDDGDCKPICRAVWERLERWYGVSNEEPEAATIELQVYSRRRYANKNTITKHLFPITV